MRDRLPAPPPSRVSLLARYFADRWDLSPRESEILSHVLAGATGNKRLADEVGISVRTVETYMHAISRKSGLSGRTELASFLLRGYAGFLQEVGATEFVGQTPRVLLLDDDLDVLTLLSRELRSRGIVASCLSYVDDGLASTLKSENIEVLVCDYILPGSNGLAVIRRLGADFLSPTPILITGYPERMDEAADAPPILKLLKPIDIAELVRLSWAGSLAARMRRALVDNFA